MKEYYVYIMTNRSRTLYVGMTNNIARRIEEHRLGMGSKFASKYRIKHLVYYESTNDVHEAIAREKRIKGWRRAKKIVLIESANPEWRDLSDDW